MTTLETFRDHGLFDARVPRYTSYPTAPHFSPRTGPAQAARWIEGITAGEAISLYIHVPFCRRLCWFCACRTQGTQSLAPVEDYLDSLLAEIDLLDALLPAGVTLSRLHLGGGTPTLLSPDQIDRLTQAVYRVLPPAHDSEISVEIDPNELDAPRLDALARAGMTRASIGVQDFDPEIQETIGRRQSYEVTRRAVDGLRARGVESLNADILFGLPHQSPARLADSVQKLLSLSPDRVALFGYAHVPWVAKRQRLIPESALPSPEARLELFRAARQLFFWDGYREIGIDHFARPGDGLDLAARSGRLRRNFQGYTDDRAEVLIGLGASAISRFPQGYAQNAAATGAYHAAIRAGRLATARGHAFSEEDLCRGAVIEALMCDFAADAGTLAVRAGLPRARLAALIDGLPARFPDLLEHAPGHVALPPAVRPLARIVARALDAYDAPEGGHSRAI